MLSGKRILLGVTGSIAAYKSLQIVRDLTAAGANVQVVLTPTAHRFVSPLTLKVFSGQAVLGDLFDPDHALAHLDLAQGTDLILIAPITAHFIAKMAVGLADDLLSTLLLASTAPVFIAPAMDLGMWEHPTVQENMTLLRKRGVEVIEPETGPLASGKEGIGRLAKEKVIVERLRSFLSKDHPSLSGEFVLVTAGPTQEPIDPVRFISNRSSGKMGYALAEVAREWGGRVILISGPTRLESPNGVELVSVRTTDEMRKAFDAYFSKSTIVIMAAAVSDYRPVQTARKKIKKTGDSLVLRLEETEDIIGEQRERRTEQIVVGFAAETEALVENAQKKRMQKRLDLIIANDVTEDGAGFDVDTNIVHLINASGEVTPLPKMSKRELARKILIEVVRMKSTLQADIP